MNYFGLLFACIPYVIDDWIMPECIENSALLQGLTSSRTNCMLLGSEPDVAEISNMTV